MVGCGQYPNPNDLSAIAPEFRVDVANRRLLAAEAILQYKVEHREITDERRNELIREVSEDFLKKVDPTKVPDSDQWMYASLLRVTDRWPEAEASLKIAVKVAKTPDRRVNDTLKLAQAMAKNGEVAEAIVTAETIFDAADVDVAPILVSVLYEIVPATKGKGHDKELVDLVQKAVECQERAKVDEKSEGGRAFLLASRYHLNNAAKIISELSGTKI